MTEEAPIPMSQTLREQIKLLHFGDGDIDEITPENIAIQTGYNAALDDVLTLLAAAEGPPRTMMVAVADSLQAARTAHQNGAIDVPHLLAVVQAECERLRYHAAEGPQESPQELWRQFAEKHNAAAAWVTQTIVAATRERAAADPCRAGRTRKTLSPSEAVYAFAGWLTCRRERTVMSSTDDAAPIAELVDQFCKRHRFADPREGWNKNIVPPAAPAAAEQEKL